MSAAQARPQIVSAQPAAPHPAIDYLEGTFREGDHIFFFAVHAWKTHPNKKGVSLANVKTYPLMPLSVATSAKTMAQLERDQTNGWNIFLSMNPFPVGSPSRVESLIKTIRNVFIETDTGSDVLKTIAFEVADGIIPAPHSVLQSSPGKFHIAWHVDDIKPEEAKALNRALASRYGGDVACVDLHRVLRMPGFRNLKPKYPDKPVCELVEPMLGAPAYTREQFKIETVVLKTSSAPVSEGVLANIIASFEQNAGEAGFKLGPRVEDLHGYRWDVACPWAETHTYGGKDAILMVIKDGRLEFSCLHHHCARRGWSDIRQLWETAAGHKQKFASTKELQEMILSKDGAVKAIIANAIKMLKDDPAWQGVLAYNELTLMPEKLKPAPWETGPGRTCWSDHDDAKLAEWFQHHNLFIDNVKKVGEAVNAVARESSYHPVRKYLDSLQWDGKRRLNTWLSRYLGAPDSRFVRAAGRCWLLSAVARIYRPGCKVDYILVVEGAQGATKSQALNILAGGDEFFLDDFARIDDKDALLKMHGAWIIEWAELTAARRDANKVKSFVTSKDDVFRAPYDKRPQHHPRMCVFAASTNDDVWMSDETGGRRFWPVKCGKIDLGKLERDRNQLWAEAVARYKAGEKWWFQSNALNDMATEAQRDRYLRGPWDSIIEKYLDSLAKKQVTIDEIRSNVICAGLTPTPISQWKQADMNSVARCLVHNGWKRRQVRVEGSGLRKWVYELSPVGVVTEKDSGDKT